jgi:hypothetical protein
MEDICHGLIAVYYSICLKELGKAVRDFTQSSHKPRWDLNQAPPKCKLEALTLEAVCLMKNVCLFFFQ